MPLRIRACLGALALLPMLASSLASANPATEQAWHASWIAAPGAPHSAPNTWTVLRRTFTLATVPDRAEARIAADTKYWLHLNGRIQLSWSAIPSGTTALQLETSPLPGGPFSPLVQLPADQTGHTDFGLPPGATRSYRLTARAGIWSSPFSNTATASTPTLADDWRLLHFGTRNNSGRAADLQDPDGDGRPNRLEFALGTNPNAPDPAPASPALNGATLELHYQRSSAAAGDGLSFVGQWSDSLALDSWRADSVTHQQTSPANPQGISSWKASVPTSPPRRFLRIMIP